MWSHGFMLFSYDVGNRTTGISWNVVAWFYVVFIRCRQHNYGTCPWYNPVLICSQKSARYFPLTAFPRGPGQNDLSDCVYIPRGPRGRNHLRHGVYIPKGPSHTNFPTEDKINCDMVSMVSAYLEAKVKRISEQKTTPVATWCLHT